MGPDKKSHSSRHKVRRLLSQWPGPLPIKAMQVAFPIRKVVYSVTERQLLDLGLVERYIVEAAKRFGPLPVDEVAGLLGLELGLVRRLVRNMGGDQGSLACEGDTVTASPERSIPPHQVVTHDRAFAVAAVGGALLPIDAAEILESNRIVPDGPRERFLTNDGDAVKVRGNFSPHPHHDGVDEIRRLVDAAPELGTKYGLPLGLVQLGDRRPEQEEEYWIEALLLVIGNGPCKIRPVDLPHLDLLQPPYDRFDFVADACAGLPIHLLENGVDLSALQTDVRAALPKARLLNGSHEGRAVLQHPGEALPVPRLLDDPGQRWLASLLDDGIWWHQYSGSVVRVAPGDATTVTAAAAIRLHSMIKRDASSVRDDPRRAWRAVVESVHSTCAQGFTPPELQLADAVARLRRVNDNAVQRALDHLEDHIEMPA